MINPTLEFLKEIKGKKVLITTPFQSLNSGVRVDFLDYKLQSQNIILTFIYKKKQIDHIVNWQDDLPFTHFTFAKDAYFHAKRVKKRFRKEIEDVVFLKSPKLLFLYAIAFIKERFPENLEKIVVQNPYYAYKYAKNFLGHRLEEDQEEIFLKDKTGESLVLYAIEILKSRLSDKLHNFLILKSMEYKDNRWLMGLFKQYFVTYSPENACHENSKEEIDITKITNEKWAVNSYMKSYNVNSVTHNTNSFPNNIINTYTFNNAKSYFKNINKK